MTDFKSYKIGEIKEIFCRGGEDGFRIVHIKEENRILSQSYHSGTAKNSYNNYELILEGGIDVTLMSGDILQVVQTKEILEPYRIILKEGRIIDL